jgi:hypothetical protein
VTPADHPRPALDGTAARRLDIAARVDAVDFVNRVNFLFDRWDPAALLDCFTDDVTVEHPLGRSEGRAELAAFLEAYEPITLGVRRHNCNHVVDVGPEDGEIVVTYHILLVRIAPSSEAARLRSEPMAIMHYEEHLPKLISYALVSDTLRPHRDGGFRIRRKHVSNVAEDVVFHF